MGSHKGIFHPNSIKHAARRFQEFFTQKLSENGINKATKDRIKYHEYTIPVFAVDITALLKMGKCTDLISEMKTEEVIGQNIKIRIDLPTASGSSACIGGIELLQRLYMETIIHCDVETFVVELIGLRESHGDNWCFDGMGNVLMANGEHKRIKELKVGDCVRSFGQNKVSMIRCVIVSNLHRKIAMVK